MTKRAELLALAERVEVLSGAEREVDAAIVEAIGYQVLYDAAYPRDRTPYYQPDKDRSWTAVPLYTSSLDAAMTLVPEGYDWAVTCEQGVGVSWCVGSDGVGSDIVGKTPALALTAACLRALAEKEA